MTPLQRASGALLRKAALKTIPDTQPRARDAEELVELFSAEVFRFVSAQMRRQEDAEDVVMETFAAAFRDFGRVAKADDQRHWLLSIARRKVADFYRKHYRRAERPLALADLAAPMTSSEEGEIARAALAELPDAQREVLTLKYVSGLSVAEIAGVVRRSPAAINSLLQRGRESLRAALGVTK